MAIDDPIQAAEDVLAAEARDRSPIRSFAAQVADFVPGSIGIALSELLREDAASKLEYLLEVLKKETGYLRERVDKPVGESEQHRRFALEQWPALALAAFRRAEQSRTRDRISRIGRILSRSLAEAPPPSPDDIEELMRIAMELSDRDVIFLDEVARLQGPVVTGDGRTTQLSQTTWAASRLTRLGMTVEDVFAIGPKLESYGLIRETGASKRGVDTPKPWPYALLPKGRNFLNFVAGSAKRNSD